MIGIVIPAGNAGIQIPGMDYKKAVRPEFVEG
jgi:hypothetical protein